MASPLIMPLFEGPIDVVGDIHGEAGPLFQLLDVLGYDGEGNHPEGRRLVFVGDLVDRGPDSISVVTFVKQLVQAGRAQAILGNHELNLLLGSHKHGNHWFWGETEAITKDKKEGSGISFQRLATREFREEALSFFRTLPIVLERSDVRVVHACWDPEAIAALRDHAAACAAAASAAPSDDADGAAVAASRHFDASARARAAAAADDIERELLLQNGNPVKCLTSGREARTPEPFFAGGRARYLARARWWEAYSDPQLVVFGHYWRAFPRPAATPAALAAYRPSGDDLFAAPSAAAAAGAAAAAAAPAGEPAARALGPAGTAVCVDFSVGLRYEERGKRLPPGALGTHLVALRLPERALHREDGAVFPLAAPAAAAAAAAAARPAGEGGA